jgi:hypothetical protein
MITITTQPQALATMIDAARDASNSGRDPVPYLCEALALALTSGGTLTIRDASGLEIAGLHDVARAIGAIYDHDDAEAHYDAAEQLARAADDVMCDHDIEGAWPLRLRDEVAA